MTMCKDLGFDILALSETQKWRSDIDAIFSEQPEDGEPHLAPSQIDYVIVSKRWSTSFRSCKVAWGPKHTPLWEGKVRPRTSLGSISVQDQMLKVETQIRL